MKKGDIIIGGYILSLLVLMVDAIYLILQPVEYISKNQAKLFDTMMYQKSSFFFMVTNGVNFSLLTTYPLIIFLLWGHSGGIIGILYPHTSIKTLDKRYRKVLVVLLLLLPPSTWNMLLMNERFGWNNPLVPLIIISILGILYGLANLGIITILTKRQEDAKIVRISYLFSTQIGIYIIAIFYILLSYVD